MELQQQIRNFYGAGERITTVDMVPVFFDELMEVVLPAENPMVKRHLSREILTRFALSEEFKQCISFIKQEGLKALMEQEERRHQFGFFIELGDFCLFLTGMFPEFLGNRRNHLGENYFVSYGRGCYYAALHKEFIFERRELFGELADNFRKYKSLFNEISKATFQYL